MTDVHARSERQTDTALLTGVETLARLLVVRHQLDERGGLTDRDHGVGLSGVAARRRSTSRSSACATCSPSTGSCTARA